MPPDLDIYVLVKRRDSPTIERFLDGYVDRLASYDRGDEELMLIPLSAHDAPSLPDRLEDWEWEPARTLAHVTARGLDYPRRAFIVYLASRRADVGRAILAFTMDDQLVLGLSVEDTPGLLEGERAAQALIIELTEKFGAHLGLVAVEQPPPLSESAFREQEGAPLTVYFHEWKPVALPDAVIHPNGPHDEAQPETEGR